MLEFYRPTLADRLWISQCHEASGKLGCEYSFANLFTWGTHSQVAKMGPFMLQRILTPTRVSYLFPAGPQDASVCPALNAIMEDAKALGLPMRFLGMSKEETEKLERCFPGRFQSHFSRNHCDYLYDIDRLAELKGKKLQAKRNHINRFVESYPDWYVEPMTKASLPACKEFLAQWYEKHTEPGVEGHDYTDEARAIGVAMDHLEELDMEGLLLWADGRLMAFTLGNRFRENAFDVNYEKADPEIQGSYPLINREFARWIRQKYPQVRLLNREDDLGLPGLRRAKESYYPDVLLEKYTAETEGPVL